MKRYCIMSMLGALGGILSIFVVVWLGGLLGCLLTGVV